MAGRITRISQAAASPATADSKARDVSPVSKSHEHKSTSPSITNASAPASLTEAPPHSVKPEQVTPPPIQATDTNTSTTSSSLTSVEPEQTSKIIHQTWERVCHAVPKCDGCDKKAGQVGILQRCVSCTWQICRTCVENGKLEQKATSGHPALHVMDLEDVDWSPATRAEKAAQTKRKRAAKKAAADAAISAMTPVKGKAQAAGRTPTKLAAIRGVGLRTIVPKAVEDADERQCPPTTDEDHLIEAHVEADVLQPLNHLRKRSLSPEENGANQGPEKYLRVSDPFVTPSRHLAPIRPVMEPIPTPCLPSMSHIGLHSFHHDRHDRVAAEGLRSYGSQSLAFPHATDLRTEQHFSQSSVPRATVPHNTSERDASHARGTHEEPGGISRAPSRYASISPRSRHRCGLGVPPRSELGQISPRPSYMDLRTYASNQHSLNAPSGGEGGRMLKSSLPSAVQYHDRAGLAGHRLAAVPPPPPPSQHQPAPTFPSIQDLASELYQDVRQTHRDYPSWPLPTCLLHEISRSWSRGALHRLAVSIGPGGVGFDTLYAVAERVSDWLDLRDNWQLREWLDRERTRFGRA